MTSGPIPIVLAISGHRDLLEEDFQPIGEALNREFAESRSKYPHSRLQLLNGLAEGADWLAAEAAVNQGLELIAVLPMPQAEYEQDFGTPETLTRFRRLLAQANEVRVAPMAAEVIATETRDACYQSLGIYLARHAQCLYALWDGKTENSLPGGTTDVVRLCQEGAEVPNNPLAQPETCWVRHLRCRRKKNPDAWSEPLANTWADCAATERTHREGIFSSIEDFNQAALNLQQKAPAAITKSRSYLLGEVSPPPGLEPITQAFAIADALAGARQKQRGKAVWLISLLAFLSVVFQQIHLGPDMQWYWLALHVGFGLCAFSCYGLFFTGRNNREAQHLDWRALAEGLRVQIFWQAAGLDECVSNHYLNSQRDELNWIRQSIRNTHVQFSTQQNEPDLGWIYQRWVNDQRKYFLAGNNSANKKQRLHARWARASMTAFSVGLLGTIGLMVYSLLDPTTTIIAWLSLFAALAFIVAAIMRNYSSQMAYAENANRYSKMGVLFDRAMEKLAQEKTHSKHLSLLKAIGKEALAENTEWLLMHRQRKFKIPSQA